MSCFAQIHLTPYPRRGSGSLALISDPPKIPLPQQLRLFFPCAIYCNSGSSTYADPAEPGDGNIISARSCRRGRRMVPPRLLIYLLKHAARGKMSTGDRTGSLARSRGRAGQPRSRSWWRHTVLGTVGICLARPQAARVPRFLTVTHRGGSRS